MTEMFLAWLPIALILCFGIFIQAAAGFAAGLLIVPALMWFGYTIRAAQTALLVATIPQNVWGVWSLRESIPLKRVMIPGCVRVLFFPLGLLTLRELENLPTDTLRQLVGVFILIATLLTILVRPEPRESLHPAWSWLTFPLSGFIQGLVGMGGPVMVLWVQAHHWSTRQSRGFLFAMYLISLLPALVVLFLTFGDRVIAPGFAAAMSIPLLWVSTHYGLKVGSYLGRVRLRRVTLGLLFLFAFVSIASPWY